MRWERSGDEAQIELSLPCLDAHLGNDIVEDRHEVGDFGRLVVEVLCRPRREIAARLLGHREPLLRVGRERDLVEGCGDVSGEDREVRFATGLRIVPGADGLRVGVGLLPVHQRFVDRQHLQLRIRRHVAEWHRKYDTITDTRELAIAHERGAVGEKNPEEKRGRRLRTHPRKHVSEREYDGENYRLWKSCGRTVHLLWTG